MSDPNSLKKYKPVINAVVESTPLRTFGNEDIRARKEEILVTQETEVKRKIMLLLMRTGVEMGNVVSIEDMDAVIDLTYRRMKETLQR